VFRNTEKIGKKKKKVTVMKVGKHWWLRPISKKETIGCEHRPSPPRGKNGAGSRGGKKKKPAQQRTREIVKKGALPSVLKGGGAPLGGSECNFKGKKMFPLKGVGEKKKLFND